MTLNCADGMIVTFVSGLTPPFKIDLTQGTCRQKGVVSRDISGTPDNVTHQIYDTGNDPTGTS